MSQYPPTIPGPLSQSQRPHRGVLVLVLGIVGIILCVVAGIVAWVLGSSDLREMDAGRMDPSGRGLTQAGKILGIISVVLNCLAILAWIALVMLGMGAAVIGGASQPGSP